MQAQALATREATIDKLFADNFEPLWMKWQREYFEQTCQSQADLAWRIMAEESNRRIARKWAHLDMYGRPKRRRLPRN